MEFWGVEVKNGELLKVDPGEDMIVHISQAALGKSKNKGNEPVYLHLKVNNQKLIIGTLNQEKFPQMSTEIVLEKGFELSHSWKNGSVYFSGYKVDARDTEADDYSDDELPVAVDKEKSKPNANQGKPSMKETDAAKSGTKQVNFKVPNEDAKVKQDDDDSDEDSEDDFSTSEDSGDDELPVAVEKEKSKPNANLPKPDTKKTDAAKSGTKQLNFKVQNKGAKAKQDDDDSDEDSEDNLSTSEDSGDDELPVAVDKEKSKPNAIQAKPNAKKTDAAKSGTKQVNFKVPNKDAKAKQDDDDSAEDSEDDFSTSDDSGADEDKKIDVGDGNKLDSDDDESSDEDTLKKPEPSKKRPAEAAALKMPASAKKAKFATPQKTEVKKSSVHIATPHPAKRTGKKPAIIEASKQQTPKSGGSYPCKSCNRSFTSEAGLESHTKAKHGAAA